MSWDLVVVGAGLVGLGAAWEMAQQGWQVLVVERGEAGAGASRAAAGMLAPTAEVSYKEEALLKLNRQSLAMYPAFVERLEQCSGMGVDYRIEGTLVVALDRDDTEALERLHQHQRRLGLPAEHLSSEAATAKEPALGPNVHSALWCPDDHQVDPRLLVGALVQALARAGGSLRTGCAVESLVVEQGRVIGVEVADGEVIKASRVLVAAGAWSRKLGGVARDLLPGVRPIRGQMIALSMEPGALCTHVVRAPDAYMVPKSDGRLLIGATMEEMGFDPRLTAGGVFELLRGAWEAMPGIYDLPVVDMWSGFRPMTWENEPRVGPSEALGGLWFATGHGRHGVLLTPWTMQRVREMFQEGEP